ncbi:hypothetical protein KSS87_001374, partial [Heliosperma pusillum]
PSLKTSRNAGVGVGVAMSNAEVEERLAGVPVYALSNSNEEFVLVSGIKSKMPIGLFCIKKEDADSLLNQVRLIYPNMRRGSSVVPVALNKVFQLKVNGVAFRLIPEASQLKNALRLQFFSRATEIGQKFTKVTQADLNKHHKRLKSRSYRQLAAFQNEMSYINPRDKQKRNTGAKLPSNKKAKSMHGAKDFFSWKHNNGSQTQLRSGSLNRNLSSRPSAQEQVPVSVTLKIQVLFRSASVRVYETKAERKSDGPHMITTPQILGSRKNTSRALRVYGTKSEGNSNELHRITTPQIFGSQKLFFDSGCLGQLCVNYFKLDQSPDNPTTIVPVQRKRKRRTRCEIQADADRNLAAQGSGVSVRPRTRYPLPHREALLAADTSRPIPGEYLCLPPARHCPNCFAFRYAFESKHFCCGDGDIVLAHNDYPEELVRLYTSPDEDAVHFRKYARLYNNLFAFSSIGGDINAKTHKGIYVFRLHGQIYHHVPSLVPINGNPKYLQLYFYDGQHEAENRTGCFREIRQDVVDILIHVTKTNPYARFFRSLRDIEITEETQIVINKTANVDQRVYNAPTSDEVAVVWSESSSSSASSSPHIMVTGNNNASHRIMHYYGCYDPLQYPLLFPAGDSGWAQNLEKKNKQNRAPSAQPVEIETVDSAETLLDAEEMRAGTSRTPNARHISCREYYCYKLQHRPKNMLLRAGRCLQQYIVDMYVKVENTRLDFFRRNQETIRADLYQGILDTVGAGETSAINVGRRLILPPTFIGGPRDMKKRYLNAMALVQRYGKPDLFITITCNANWPEIKAALAAGETAQNRPDLVARVFRAKLLALKKQIMERKVFGEVAAYISVVEFQKRGLPHAHILIILKPGYQLRGPNDFDKFVSAEIPPQDNPALRESVLKHMMHGPCGQLNTTCPCMTHKKSVGKCKYNYPRQFTSNTTNNSDGYPVYRRRDNGEKVRIRGHALDNRWVISYNPYLIALFDCHLNVEGSLNEGVDEIERYQAGRWVSPCEAAWRLFGFDLFEIHPPVMPLPVHLPNMQTLHIRPYENLEVIISNEKRCRTPLTEFFKTNCVAPSNQLYGNFTEHFRLDRSQKGPKSFDDLLTVNGHRCATFQEAALKRRLLEEDDTIELCLSEACAVQMPSALRRLFATILVFCQPKDPKALWDKFFPDLSADFRMKFPNNSSKVVMLTTNPIEQYLEAMGKSLRSFGLDDILQCSDEILRRTRDIIDALDAPIPQECMDCRALLNVAQKHAFDSVIAHVKEGKSAAFFIDGPGGTGKTFLYNALYAEVRLMGKIVLPTATSGIAASNIPSGRTAHSRFKIPIDVDASLACDVPKQSSLAALIKETSLIIWDEASMARKENVESLNSLLQDLCDPTSLFGGKIVVFGGDFRQILPVVPHKSIKESVEASLVNSPLWSKFTRFSLTENIRAREDPAFSNFLLRLGNGQLQREDNSFVGLPQAMIKSMENCATEPIITVAAAAFPELFDSRIAMDIYTDRAILTPMNEDVDSINAVLIEKFPGTAVTYKSFDTMLDDNCNIYPSEFINKLCPGGMSSHELILKENCPVILLRNLLPAAGLCNGTRLLCKRFFPNLIECVITTGHHKGENVFIPRIKLRPSTSANYPFQFQRNQFPLKLSFAMTINKSQGQTLNQVAIYLPRPCFSPGQLYVALSRARNSNKVVVISAAPTGNLPENYVKNVISYDVLQLAGII